MKNAQKIRDLKALIKAKTTNMIPMMEGKTKGDQKDLHGEVVTLRDYGYLSSEKGEYGVFVVEEYPETFYFAGQVVTDNFKKFDEEDFHDRVVSEGVPFLLSTKKAKDSKLMYTNITFYPEI